MRIFGIYIALSLTLIISPMIYAEDGNSVYKRALVKFNSKDYKSAISLFRQAYSLGDNVLSPMRIGESYVRGLGVDQNESEGIKWIQIAAENNNPEAQFRLGRYYNHIGDDSNAFDWFVKAAQNGDENGKYWLGQAYLDGKGTIQDSKKALRWTLSSAQGGNPGAQWEMARAYFEGHTHPFDFDCNAEEFIRWTQLAADNGLPVAQFYMGMIYLDGFNGTPVDKQIAKKWLQKASDQGWEEATSVLKERF